MESQAPTWHVSLLHIQILKWWHATMSSSPACCLKVVSAAPVMNLAQHCAACAVVTASLNVASRTAASSVMARAVTSVMAGAVTNLPHAWHYGMDQRLPEVGLHECGLLMPGTLWTAVPQAAKLGQACGLSHLPTVATWQHVFIQMICGLLSHSAHGTRQQTHTQCPPQIRTCCCQL